MRLDSIHLIGGEQHSLVIPNSASTDIGSVQIGAEGKLLKVLRPSGRYQNIALDGDVVYDFVSHTFTSAGTRGAYGPSLNALLEEYQLAHWLEPEVNFNAVGGIQEWTVPETAVYRIEAQGAFGYRTNPAEYALPAIVRLDVALRAGDVLRILVGQAGLNSAYAAGGATFVESLLDGLLAVGGGGGAPYLSALSSAVHGKIDIETPQTSSSGSGIVIYTDFKGSYGAGYSADAQPFSAGITPAKSFLSGGTGAIASSTTQGGFGGGGVSSAAGGGYDVLGGGGGYSGGGPNYGQSGNGGTSWCAAGTNVTNRQALRPAAYAGQLNGHVTITKL